MGQSRRVNFIADKLIAEGKAVPAIIVMCNGMMLFEEADGIRPDYAESFPKMLLEEVIPFVEGRYRVTSDSSHRAMAGLSMGSIQTSIIALNHPELFQYVGLFSGFVQDPLTGYAEHIREEKLRKCKNHVALFFRGIGDRDGFLSNFIDDDALLQQYSISCTRKLYSGGHEWKVWRQCIDEFLPLLFKGAGET